MTLRNPLLSIHLQPNPHQYRSQMAPHHPLFRVLRQDLNILYQRLPLLGQQYPSHIQEVHQQNLPWKAPLVKPNLPWPRLKLLRPPLSPLHKLLFIKLPSPPKSTLPNEVFIRIRRLIPRCTARTAIRTLTLPHLSTPFPRLFLDSLVGILLIQQSLLRWAAVISLKLVTTPRFGWDHLEINILNIRTSQVLGADEL